jgi:hypothetical protein
MSFSKHNELALSYRETEEGIRHVGTMMNEDM